MGTPKEIDSRLFFRAAKQRFGDAEFLLEVKRTTGAVYMAGYGVECIFKALILSSIRAKSGRQAMINSFKGSRAHDFEWLKKQYEDQKMSFPHHLAEDLTTCFAAYRIGNHSDGVLRFDEAERH